jgi:hypothetical protein
MIWSNEVYEEAVIEVMGLVEGGFLNRLLVIEKVKEEPGAMVLEKPITVRVSKEVEI